VSSSAPDIHDIRAPFLIPQDWRMPALVACAAALVLVLTWWVWLKLKARRPQLTLLQRTLEKLEATRPLMEANDAQAFSVAVSDVVRAYVEARFGVLATHRTTEEFLRDCLTQVGSALQAHEQALAEFLIFCDLAKFARWSLDAEQMHGMLASARHFVESTAVAAPVAPAVAPEVIHVPIRQS
jgi:hypothetical protein